MQTTFHLFPNYDPVDSPGLLLEAGMHKPSTAETLAPFYQDPIQRIAALYLPTPYRFLVFRVGALLELVESREGSEIGWDEWKGIVVAPSVDPGRTMVRGAWVSGCRLFAVITAASSPDAEIRSFDFSIQGRAKYSSARVNTDLGGVRCLSPTDARARIPRSDWFYTQSGHDSVVLSYWHDDSTGSAARGDRCYIWTF
ncbi:hypothetical protein BJ322DRAFT_124956 [Thelephora terrestris]|uniref:Uncharacterized protein n=1 Tax=Thelephora terrestris TaxID=56493 RepID=A0A9P6HSB0_9AGAM|nr:hypothetical protein BJ322DRAFT_124956 [Thelephora terrestris]